MQFEKFYNWLFNSSTLECNIRYNSSTFMKTETPLLSQPKHKKRCF